MVLNVLGSYFLARWSVFNEIDVEFSFKVIALSLFALSIGLMIEKRTGQNFYYRLGATQEIAAVRNDRVRAQGPFRHPILAGTCGAAALPLCIFLWRRGGKKVAMLGMLGALSSVYASSSSGPVAALLFAIALLAFWKRRHLTPRILLAASILAVLLSILMGRPVWFLIARMDLVGGSTGWHRAELIDQSIIHIGEWAIAGTNFTRHWMPTGVSWSPDHTDITNYFIHLGVIGGVPLVLALAAVLYFAFRKLFEKSLDSGIDTSAQFLSWTLLAALATHTLSFFSISYFDQMFVILYITIANAAAIYSTEDSPSSE
ncbi:hypothetical protein [Nibricoccus sp. IMCC34717]|uniref:hypothetical protein n=1 Tax=Nibricoccus sp. IMCC34717 TaxID=3034021 RepID=UPI003850AAAB